MLSATRNTAVPLSVTGDPFTLFAGTDSSIFKVAIETSSAGTLVCDETLTILFSNRRIETLFGYAPGGLVGRSLEQLLPEVSTAASSPDARAFGEPKAPVADGECVMRGLCSDGSEVPVEVAQTAIARNGRRLVIFSLVQATELPQEQATPAAADDTAGGQPIAAAAATADAPRFDAHRRVVSVDERSRVRRPESRLQPAQVVAESDAVRAALTQIRQVAATSATVLLTGETGSGKEVFAQAIHDLSPRQRQEMVRVNCAAIPAGLLESELFGHERGAYTGAVGQQIGRFEQANRSSIFLDEIGELSLEGQVKLLRVLQTKQVERLGSGKPVSVDIRIIAATNKDLERAIEAREFREDLYYRLNIFPIHVPALRERIEDIPTLVWTFVDEIRECLRQARRVDFEGEPDGAAALRVAGQRARASQRGRAGRDRRDRTAPRHRTAAGRVGPPRPDVEARRDRDRAYPLGPRSGGVARAGRGRRRRSARAETDDAREPDGQARHRPGGFAGAHVRRRLLAAPLRQRRHAARDECVAPVMFVLMTGRSGSAARPRRRQASASATAPRATCRWPR